MPQLTLSDTHCEISNSCTNQSLNTQPDSTCMSMHLDQRVLALQAYSCTDLGEHRTVQEYSCTDQVTTITDQVTTKSPHSANTTESSFEIGCTGLMHEMSNDEKSKHLVIKSKPKI